jgi:catechol-2,3-dioxygenase
MWETAQAEATLPAKDLDRAKAFYSEKVGLDPTSEDKVGVHFVVGGTRFRLFRSGGAASGTHTQLALFVGDIAGQVRTLQSRGLRFEEYDYPNLKTIDGVADMGYAKAAWFKDSEGNLLGIAEMTAG